MTSTPQPNGIPRANTPARASPAPAQSSQPQPGTPFQPSQPLPDPTSTIKPSTHTLSGPTASFLAQNQSQNTTSTGATTSASAKDTAPEPPQTTPHDARTLHLLLSSLGLQSYQDRVPLQLLDLAYRYTSSILSDAAHLAAEGYTLPDTTGPGASSNTSGGGSGSGAGNASKKAKATNEGDVTLPALRLATNSRLGHVFSKDVQKSTFLGVAEERNRVRLPEVGRQRVFGVRLPEERFLLTGRGWGLGVEESEVEEDVEMGGGGDEKGGQGGMVNGVGGEEHGEEREEGMEDEDEDGEGGFEDVFGEQADEGDGDQEDENMEDG